MSRKQTSRRNNDIQRADELHAKASAIFSAVTHERMQAKYARVEELLQDCIILRGAALGWQHPDTERARHLWGVVGGNRYVNFYAREALELLWRILLTEDKDPRFYLMVGCSKIPGGGSLSLPGFKPAKIDVNRSQKQVFITGMMGDRFATVIWELEKPVESVGISSHFRLVRDQIFPLAGDANRAAAVGILGTGNDSKPGHDEVFQLAISS